MQSILCGSQFAILTFAIALQSTRGLIKGVSAKLGLTFGNDYAAEEGFYVRSARLATGTPLSQQDVEGLIQQYVDHYNNVRLHSAIGDVTPMDMLAGRQKEIQAARDRKLEEARQKRQLRRRAAA